MPGHQLQRAGVVEMAVGEQRGLRHQSVLRGGRDDLRQGVLTGVDDDAAGARRGRHQVAIRGQGSDGEACDEHPVTLSGTPDSQDQHFRTQPIHTIESAHQRPN